MFSGENPSLLPTTVVYTAIYIRTNILISKKAFFLRRKAFFSLPLTNNKELIFKT